MPQLTPIFPLLTHRFRFPEPEGNNIKCANIVVRLAGWLAVRTESTTLISKRPRRRLRAKLSLRFSLFSMRMRRAW